jgi:hypothetical protein
LTSGNALDLTTQTAQGGELDALTTINNAQRQAAGLDFQASATRAQGSVDQWAANMGATTTILNAPLQAYGAYKTLGGTWSPLATTPATSGSSLFGTAKNTKYGANPFTFG